MPCFPSERLAITVPSVSRDLLMKLPSFNDWPVVPDLLARSDPARSTRFNVDMYVGLSLFHEIRRGLLVDLLATFLLSIDSRTKTCERLL